MSDFVLALSGTSVCFDNYINSSSPTTNLGTSTSLVVGFVPAGSLQQRVLLRFDASVIPAGAIITSAGLTLNIISATVGFPFGYNASAVVRKIQDNIPWTESGSTWNDYDTGLPWTTPGGDLDSSNEVAWTMNTDAAGPFTIFGLKNIVQDAVNNQNSIIDLALLRDPESGSELVYIMNSSEAFGGNNLPQLTISYRFCDAYHQLFEPFNLSTSGSWVKTDLKPFDVPGGTVAEIAITNKHQTIAYSGGIREIGSTLERMVLLNRAETTTTSVRGVTYHVNVNQSGFAEFFAGDGDQVTFTVLGYWSKGTYVEKFFTFNTVGSAVWEDVNLISQGPSSGHVVEIIAREKLNSLGQTVGIRESGSTAFRAINVQEAEGVGHAFTSFHSRVMNPSGRIQAWQAFAGATREDFTLVGYWSTLPGSGYTEQFYNFDNSAGTDNTWQQKNLSPSGTPRYSIPDVLINNAFNGVANQMGVRASGSTDERIFNMEESEPGSTSGVNSLRMFVKSKESGSIEIKHEDVSEAHNFTVLGYWTENSNPCYLEGAIPIFVSGLGFASGGLNLFIHGFAEASGDIDCVITGHIVSSGDIDCFIHGYQNASGDIDCFIHGHQSTSGDIDLFIHGFVPSSGDIDLFIQGHKTTDLNSIYFTSRNSQNTTRGALFSTDFNGDTLSTLVNNNTSLSFFHEVAVDPVSGHVYFMVNSVFDDNNLRRCDLDGSNSVDFGDLGNLFHALSIDYINRKLYTNISNTITRFDLDGTNPEILVSSVSGMARDIAIDHTNNKFYAIVSSPSGVVERFNLNVPSGQLNGEIVYSGSELGILGKGVAVDPGRGFLYAAFNYFPVDRIQITKMGLDGSNPHHIIDYSGSGLTDLIDLAVDPIGGHLYFTQLSGTQIGLWKVDPSTSGSIERILTAGDFNVLVQNFFYLDILKINAVNFFIHGYDNASGDIDLFTEGHQLASGDIDCFIHGHVLASGDIDCFIHGYEIITNDLDLFIGGFSPDSGTIDLFIKGKPSGDLDCVIFGNETINNDLDLFIKGKPSGSLDCTIMGHETANNDIDLFIKGKPSGSLDCVIFGHETITNDIDLFIKGKPSGSLDCTIVGHGYTSGDIDLVIIGYDTASNDIDLFIHGFNIASGDIDLVIPGHDSASGDIDLFIDGIGYIAEDITLFITSQDMVTNTLDLFIKGKPSGSITLCISGVDVQTVTGDIDLVIIGHETISNTIDLFIHGHDTNTSGLNLFIHGHQSITNDIDLFVHGYETNTSGLNLFIYGSETASGDIDLTIIGHVSINNDIDLFINGEGAVSNDIDLFIHGYDVFTNDIDLFIQGFKSTDGLNGNRLFWTAEFQSTIVASTDTFGENFGIVNVETGVIQAQELAVDGRNDHIYYVVDSSGIKRTDFGGINRITLGAVTGDPSAIEIDTINDKIILATSGSSEIQRFNLDLTGQQVIVSGSSGLAVDLSFDSIRQKIYSVASGNVHRFNLDGSNGELILSDSSKSFVGVAADLLTTDIYLLTNSGEIITCQNDGSNSGLIAQQFIPGIESNLIIECLSRTLFFPVSHPVSGGIYSVNIDNPIFTRIVESGLTGETSFYDVAIVQPNALPFFVSGIGYITSDIDLYIAGLGINTASGSITLFVHGLEPKPAFACPILSPDDTIQITEELILTYQEGIDALINQIGKNVYIEFEPTRSECPNCEIDAIYGKSNGIPKSGGPRPFTVGRTCPYCKGHGFVEVQNQKCIKALVRFKMKNISDYGISTSKRKDLVVLKTMLTDADDLMRARNIIVATDVMDIVKLKARLVSGPKYNGLRYDRYVVTVWELI